MDRPLTCQEFVELVTEYLDGALGPVDRERFEAHLAQCPGCDMYVDQMRETAEIAGKLEEDHLAEPARSTLLEAFRTWKRG